VPCEFAALSMGWSGLVVFVCLTLPSMLAVWSCACSMKFVIVSWLTSVGIPVDLASGP